MTGLFDFRTTSRSGETPCGAAAFAGSCALARPVRIAAADPMKAARARSRRLIEAVSFLDPSVEQVPHPVDWQGPQPPEELLTTFNDSAIVCSFHVVDSLQANDSRASRSDLFFLNGNNLFLRRRGDLDVPRPDELGNNHGGPRGPRAFKALLVNCVHPFERDGIRQIDLYAHHVGRRHARLFQNHMDVIERLLHFCFEGCRGLAQGGQMILRADGQGGQNKIIVTRAMSSVRIEVAPIAAPDYRAGMVDFLFRANPFTDRVEPRVFYHGETPALTRGWNRRRHRRDTGRACCIPFLLLGIFVEVVRYAGLNARSDPLEIVLPQQRAVHVLGAEH